MGPTIEGLGDWAIVGGTGAFELARGIIKRNVQEEGDGKTIYGLTIHGFCAMPLQVCIIFNCFFFKCMYIHFDISFLGMT
jgi:hypothetical protein